ncbi:hypothetical protein Patl1_16593 [Pistacia atlantica]|uniref:Uncharacterized protein n=1 Tax=Pistacia atlantica TaxID=434234 RepID=A0ACC1B5K9_9ROSI|nr:hypothetical protein Patl1_16593 [Pistacia atlantica]
MKLRPDFEIARSNLMNRHPVPSLDACLSEHLREEQRIHRGGIRVEICVLSSALVVKLLVILLGIVPRSSITTARNRVISSLLVPFDLKGSRVLLIMPPLAPLVLLHCLLPRRLFRILPPTALTNPNTLTPEMVQQMIIYAFSAFELLSNHRVSSKPWYFDSEASNHMTNTVVPLSNVRNYDEDLKINNVDASSLLISAVGDLSSSLTDVFVSPNLSTNLISVGQVG